MVIFKEFFKNNPSLEEATSISLDDVIGLGGFNGYVISGPGLYVDSSRVNISGLLVKGAGSVSPQYVSLIANRRIIISFPIRTIKSIGVKKLNVLFILNDGTSIELLR